MALYNLDLFGGCEANLNWHKVLETLHLLEWFLTYQPVAPFLPTMFMRTSLNNSMEAPSGLAPVMLPNI